MEAGAIRCALWHRHGASLGRVCLSACLPVPITTHPLRTPAPHELSRAALTAGALQVDVAPEFQEIVNAFARNQVPQIQESELLRLREQEPLDTPSAAKELLVDGSGFKVSAALTPALCPHASRMPLYRGADLSAFRVLNCPRLLRRW